MVSPANAYLTQTLAGRLQLVGHVADGNFSHVLKAVDQRHNAVVDVKMLRPDAPVHPESDLEFKHEGELLAQLESSSRVISALHSGTSQITVNINGTPALLSVCSRHGRQARSGSTRAPRLVGMRTGTRNSGTHRGSPGRCRQGRQDVRITVTSFRHTVHPEEHTLADR